MTSRATILRRRDKYRVQYEAEQRAAELAALPKLDDIEAFGPLVLAIMHKCPHDVWIMLDEKPGLFDYMDDRFYMLRRVRNDQAWGRKLFAGMVRQ